MTVSDRPTPPLLHRIWVGNKPIPRRSQEYWNKFRILNRGWELRTWREDNMADFELAKFFQDCTHPAYIADLARIEVLWRNGGVYVDADVEPIGSFEPLRQYRLALARVPMGLFGTAVIVAEQANDGLRNMMDTWLRMPRLLSASDFPTDPYPLTFALSGRPELSVLETEVFYPWMWDEVPRAPGPNTLSCHHWGKSWWPTSTRVRSKLALRLRASRGRK